MLAWPEVKGLGKSGRDIERDDDGVGFLAVDGGNGEGDEIVHAYGPIGVVAQASRVRGT